jgi:WS/DGAT C-terminal domain
VSVGVLSYADQLNFDLVVDPKLVPDVAAFARGIENDLRRLGAGSDRTGIAETRGDVRIA